MKIPMVFILLSVMLGTNSIQANSDLPNESTRTSDSLPRSLQDVEADSKMERTPDNLPALEHDFMRPDLPAPAIDPEIVHEPPTVPNPEAVITPPRLDPEMTINPRTLPSYPDFSQDTLEGIENDLSPKD